MKPANPARNDAGDALAGKVAVVTGASRGIGRAIVQALVDARCTVIAASRTMSAARSKSASRPPRSDARLPITEIRCDVRDEGSVALLFATVRSQFDHVDILVNNAGTAHALQNIQDMPLEIWRKVLDTNLTGMFLCTQGALPLMRAGAVIVNNLSVAARDVFPGESAYCASKHGALGFTETLREEVRGRGIRVISFLPGPTATDIWNQFMPEAPRDKMLSPETVARALVNAIALPENATVEELRIGPTAGNL
jgi:3-oxoacyl-[acyl-carrier protein] reductase